MNEIYGMELQYESLIPIDRPKDTFLSIDTVTFLVEGNELPLDFCTMEGGIEGNTGSIIRINVCIRDFEPETFINEYEELGLSSSGLDYAFFKEHYPDTCLAEVYTDFYYTDTSEEVYLPLALKSALLIFQDGEVLDYSGRISESVQEQLLECTEISNS